MLPSVVLWRVATRQTFGRSSQVLLQQHLALTSSKRNSSDTSQPPRDIKNGPGLSDFMALPQATPVKVDLGPRHPYVSASDVNGKGANVYFEVYGCQMNVSDTEIVWSILQQSGYNRTLKCEEADVILLMTCSIRERAEDKVRRRLESLACLRKKTRKLPLRVGVLGCMAERLKRRLLEEDGTVDVICGPDAYRDLPRLLALPLISNEAGVNTILSLEETYANVRPVRLDPDRISAFVTIMRGCDNMCSYCIVPFTRGKERSRDLPSIVSEVHELREQGVREVTLLGQNVNSYRDLSVLVEDEESDIIQISSGFKTVYKPKKGGIRFARLLEAVSEVDPEMRVRFTSPHPKDFPDEVLDVIQNRPNICKALHIPAQSGNSVVLARMRRGYTREAYMSLVDRVRSKIPSVALSSDFIAGFCGETEEEFQDTLSLIEIVKYNLGFLFLYSMREKTRAYHRLKDDVPEEVKQERHSRLREYHYSNAFLLNQAQIGEVQLLLVEGVSKRSLTELQGRNNGFTKIIFPDKLIPDLTSSGTVRKPMKGDYVAALVTSCTSTVLRGVPLAILPLQEFYAGTMAEQLSSLVTAHRYSTRGSGNCRT